MTNEAASVPTPVIPLWQVRMGQWAMLLGLLASITPWVTPAIALAIGIALALTIGNPFRARQGKIVKLLLQASVVMLGFGMDLPAVLRAGRDGAIFAAVTILTTLVLGYLLGRLLGVNRTAATLISSGTAICGGSAIAAVGAAIDADDSQISVSIGTVFLLNAVALYVFPIMGHLLGLAQGQFGTWAGIGIHDVSSVVGAASEYGLDALGIATAVKLSRTLWIIPITLVFAWLAARPTQDQPKERQGRLRIQIPWFIGLFLLASALRSFAPYVASAAPTLTHIAKAGLTVTLFLIGAGLSRQILKKVGPRALVLGVGLWIFIGTASLGAILLWD